MPSDDRLSTTKAAQKLGVTAKYLREKRLELFRPGYHYWLVNPTAARPTYKWHFERCNALLTKATKDAASLESSQQPAAAGRGVQLPFLDDVEPYDIE